MTCRLLSISQISLAIQVWFTAQCCASPPTITAPPLVNRGDPSVETRTDFLGYFSGLDNTWTPTFCYGFPTFTGSVMDCCVSTESCYIGIGCTSGKIIETIIEPGTRSRTQTSSCGGGINPLPSACSSGFFLQSVGDTKTLTTFYCGVMNIGGGGGNRQSTIYRTFPADAPVWVTTPSYSYSPFPEDTTTSTSRSSSSSTAGQSQKTSSTSSSSNTGTSNQTSTRPTSTNTPSSGDKPEGLNSDGGDGGGGGLSHTEKIALGIGVGLGVPLVLIALLAWFCPHPLRRVKEWRTKSEKPTMSPSTGNQIPPQGWPGQATHVNTGLEAPIQAVPYGGQWYNNPPTAQEIYPQTQLQQHALVEAQGHPIAELKG